MTNNKKRAPSGMGSIRKRSVTRDGKEYFYWQGRISFGKNPVTGQSEYKTVSRSTQKECREAIQQIAADLNAGTYFSPSSMPFSQWAETWQKQYLGNVKYLTQRNYETVMRTHIVPAIGATKLAAITPPQIQPFINKLQEEELAPKTIKNVHGTLSRCLSDAVMVGYLRENPCSRVILPKIVKPEIHPLMDAEIPVFLNALHGDEYENLITIILFCGLRESEAIGLTWDEIDFRKNTVTVAHQIQRHPMSEGGFQFTPPKNSKPRTIKTAPAVMAIFKRQYALQSEQRLQAGVLWKGWNTPTERKTALVFTTALGENVSERVLYEHVKSTAKKIGRQDLRVHDLRHSYAVIALQNGDDYKTLQANLGHSSAQITLDVYSHVSEQMKAQSANRLQSYIEGVQKQA